MNCNNDPRNDPRLLPTQHVTQDMQRNASKEDLREQVAHVTMEIHRLQDKAQDLRDVFTELSSV